MPTYYVEGKTLQSDEKNLRQKEILEMAGYSPEAYYLVSESGTEYRQPDDQVPIAEGEKFSVKPHREIIGGDVIHYEVNGERQRTNISPVALKIILMNAGREAGVDPNDLQNYRLENIATGDRYNDPDEPVPVREGDKFVAIYTGSTPVA